jgi:outer membrane protein assembly factor BamA
VSFDESDTLPSEITQHAGEPLDPEKVRSSTRRLFDSGRYRDITVRGVRQGDGMILIFAGTPRFYVGRVIVVGVKSDRLTSLLTYATKLNPGMAYTDTSIPTGTEGIKEILKQQGYY